MFRVTPKTRSTGIIVFLAIILAIALALTFMSPGTQGKEGDKGGVPHPTPTVSVVETPTVSVQLTSTPTPLRGRRIFKKAGGYSIVLPEDWVDRNSSPYDALLALRSGAGEGNPPWFRVQAAPSFASAKWLENYEGPPGSIQPAHIDVEPMHTIRVANWEWQRFVTADPNDEARQLYILTDREGGGFYLFHAVTWTRDWDTYLPLFEGIIASFAFERIEVPPPVTPTQVPTSTPKPY